MPTSRFYTLGVFVFWAAAMSWLVATKVAPALRGGDRPQFSAISDDPQGSSAVECWTMHWGDRKVGWAATMLTRQQDGLAQTRSIVRFDELPLGEMMQEMFGPAARVFEPLLGGGGSSDFEIPMTIESHTLFNSLDQLIQFNTTVDIYQDQRLANLHGDIDDGQLTLTVRIETSGNELPEYKRQLELSPDALVLDAFAPQTSLKPLWVGQKWTMRVYRPFPPNRPEQLLEGHVEQLSEITWQGAPVETFEVVYREDPGAGVTVTREPISRMWVARDGQVLRQEMALGGQKFVLERMAGEEAEEVRELLRRVMTM